MLSTCISITIIILLIIYNIYNYKKYKQVYRKDLYNKIKKLKIAQYCISLIMFVIFFIINLGTNPTSTEVITSIINSLSVTLLAIPLSLETLYLRFFNDEEKYSHIKTVVTNIYNSEIISKLNKANINLILLSNSKTKLKTIKEEQITSEILKETIQIKTENMKIIDKKINKEVTIKELRNLEKLYQKIEQSRATHDNYIRTIKYLVSTYLSLILSYLFVLIMKFPLYYNILSISILKLYTTIKTEYLFKYLPYDKDIMIRTVKPPKTILGKQESMFLIMESFIISFAITIPYMYCLANGASLTLASTISIIIAIIINNLLPYYYLNDTSFILNIFKEIKNIRLHIFTIITVILICILNYTSIFGTKNITLQNNIGSLIISFIFLTMLEIPKLARFASSKGRKKNELKNNKKQRRSKPNHS